MFSRVTTVATLFAIAGLSLGQAEILPPGMQEVIRDLDRTASEAVRSPNDIGYTLGVVTQNGLAWTKSYGFADSGRRRPHRGRHEYGIRVATDPAPERPTRPAS